MSDYAKKELCKSCSVELVRNYTTGGIKTGDGFKN